MDKEAIKSKIKKLLALSADNPSEAESMSALEKAQELMVQYKISENELDDGDKKECINIKTNFSYSTRSSDSYLARLADIIADNFCCITYLSRMHGAQSRTICFMGMEEDVKIAEEAMNLANIAIIRGYNRVYYDVCKQNNISYLPARHFNPLKEGYVDGYLAGLKKVFDDQKAKNQEWGLVLVAPQEAQDFLAGLDSFSSKPVRYNNSYYDDGYNDGKKFNMNKKIDEGQRRIEG